MYKPNLKSMMLALVFIISVPLWADSRKSSEISVGNVMPDVSEVTDLYDSPVKFSDYRGKILLVDVWSKNCGYCKKAIPHLRDLLAAMSWRPFELITVSINESPGEVLEIMDEESLPFTNWISKADSATTNIAKWGIKGLPALILVDANGIVRHRGSSLNGKLMPLIEQLVSAVEG